MFQQCNDVLYIELEAVAVTNNGAFGQIQMSMTRGVFGSIVFNSTANLLDTVFHTLIFASSVPQNNYERNSDYSISLKILLTNFIFSSHASDKTSAEQLIVV